MHGCHILAVRGWMKLPADASAAAKKQQIDFLCFFSGTVFLYGEK